jgi:hypothetical protein
MISKRILFLVAILLHTKPDIIFAQQKTRTENTQQTLRRKDSFFGLHFDFHATLADEHIGRTLTYGMIDTLLKEVRPDFIQVDCKGHPGISSYPTKVGTPASGFDKDPLQLWRKVTKKYGVALYVHYSGVYDKQAVKLHPDWAAVNAGGKIDSEKTSVFGPYVDRLLIPQLKELCLHYKIDGIWVDGDCWAAVPDYSANAIKLFRQETGIANIPHTQEDSGYADFLAFNRKGFLNYVQHYATALHLVDPNFQIASNWAFSSFMPRPVNIDVDFLSGDMTGLENAAFEGRCLSSQGLDYNKPWDIMSWSFTYDWDTKLQTQKSAVQLEQEAAEIISMGGGFQCYFTQTRDASIRTWQIPIMKELSKFMNSRRAFCKGSVPIPQIAVLYSGASFEKKSGALFTNGGQDAMRGDLMALLDGQNAVEITMEQHLHGKMKNYPLIVVPEWDWLEISFKNELLQYAHNGGKLLVIGAGATRLFAKDAGLSLGDDSIQSDKIQYLGFNGTFAGMKGDYQPISLSPNIESFGNFYDGPDFRLTPRPASCITQYGSGQIAFIVSDMGENYLHYRSFQERDLINGLVSVLFSNPIIKISGTHQVHVAINTLGSKTIIHLTNTTGQPISKDLFSYDEITAGGPLVIQLKIKKPIKLILQPENIQLPFTYSNGKAEVKIPSVKIHSMIVAE